MSKNLKTLICCVLSLVFVCGTIVAVFADSNGAFTKTAEAVSVTEEASDVETTTVVETTTEAVVETTTVDEEISEEATDEETTTEEVVVIRLGDVNFDGEITAGDARLALRFSAELEDATPEQLIAAEVVADGAIFASDARRILRVSAELDDESVFGTPADANVADEVVTA